MLKKQPVSKVMTKNPTTIHEAAAVSELRKIFEDGDIHHVPVVSGDTLVGIVSWSDFLRVSFGEFGNQDGRQLDTILDHTYKPTDLMTRNPVVIPATSTVRDAARLLSEGDFHALPVVEGETLVGIVTSTDLLKYLAEL